MRFMIMRKTDRSTETGARVTFCEGKPTVTHGPFAETKELMTGFEMIDAASKEEAIEWVRSRPPVRNDAEVEIREVGCAAGLVGVSPSNSMPKPGPDPQFLILLKANKALETGFMPDETRLNAMAKRNQEATTAGVMLAGEGLQPSSRGARVKFSGGKAAVIDGPFTEAKELIAGFWLIQVKSQEEAIAWVTRYPYPMPDVEIEIRRVADGGFDD
jgi:hypothetical protein